MAFRTAIRTCCVARILIAPAGSLETVPDVVRYGAVAAGFAIYMAARKSVFAGVVAGEIVVIGGKWWMG